MIFAESGFIAPDEIAETAGYVTPVIGFVTGTTRMSPISFCVGSVLNVKRAQRLANTLVVEEVEELVFEDRPAKVHAELIAVEGVGFWKGTELAVLPTIVGLEEGTPVIFVAGEYS